MTMFSGDTANLGKAFDDAWKAISEEYAGALINPEASREVLAHCVIAAARTQQNDLIKLAEQALADFKANHLAYQIAPRT